MDPGFIAAVTIPPAAGALIGYVTNKIAIIMLFRPHEKKKILGIPVPLTPGIIPRQRYELSKSIGRQVARELFTEESVMNQLETDSFKTAVQEAFLKTGSQWAEMPLKSLLSSLKGDNSFIPAVLQTVGSSPGLHELLNSSFTSFLENFICGSEDSPGEQGFLDVKLSQACSLGDIVTPGVESAVVAAMESAFPLLRELILQWLDRPSTRNELHRRGILLMRDAVDSLNSFQRLFVIAGQYDRTMEEKMSFLVDRFTLNLTESIKSPSTAETLITTFREYIKKNRRRSLKELFQRDGAQEFSRAFRRILDKPDLIADIGSFSLRQLTEHLPENVLLGDLLDWNSGGSDRLVPVVSAAAGDLIRKAVPGALKVMDIEKLVVNRIDSLAIERVETLLLEVIEKQLKWINIFGAFLGAVIGGVQVLLYVLGL